jgi:DNA-directed RNA polymerase specialized sigma subunit
LNFIEQLKNGMVTVEAIDDFVDAWHESDSDLEIYEYLGMTEEEYGEWVMNGDQVLNHFLVGE